MGKTHMMIARGGHAHTVCFKHYSQSGDFHLCSVIKKVAVGSNTQWRGKSYAASVPSSDVPSDAQRRKRVSKDERQAMVHSFVNKYREMNAGKFPTSSATRKEVGGSYYTIRKIIQELEYNSKIPPLDSRKGSPLTEAKDGGSELPSGAENTFSEEGSHSDLAATQSRMLKEETGDVSHPCVEISENVNAEEVSPSCFKKPEDDKEEALHNDFDFVPAESQLLKEETEDVSHPCLEISGDVKKKEAQGDHPGFAATEDCQLVEETKKVLPPCLENADDGKKEQAVYEDLPNADVLETKVEQRQGSIEQDKVAKDTSSRQTNDAEVPKKSSLWGNMKSFAEGIVRIWRKM
ncbi:uncharacterized protein LOC132184265 isoform X3 [Corylus avellana]|uniref:uncharacterized protein LOC132184265 isoform X3 n=1 Tax=Corylus avellana TaxID=13451 RepID=UPI00286D5FA5|nr:uncharacterized protein LOC132184265 isoform X3 [Corylus avellana]